MSTVKLMQGDCCEKLNEIPAHSVNLVLADPPYGITHQAWDTVLPFEDFIMKDGKRPNKKHLKHTRAFDK